jgi:hypothetical protein
MVPSDPKVSRFRHRHARPVARQPDALMESSLLPAAPFESRGSVLQRPPDAHPAGAACSQRPFAPPKRSPVARFPLRDRCSRPAASRACQTILRPVRFASPSLLPVRPGAGEIIAANPLPDSCLVIPIRLRVEPSPLGSFEPRRIKAFNSILNREARLLKAPGFPSLPAAFSTVVVRAADQRSRSVSLSLGLLFLEPLGTKAYVHSELGYSQMNFVIRRLFSSTIFTSVFCNLPVNGRACSVDKTRQAQPVAAFRRIGTQ